LWGDRLFIRLYAFLGKLKLTKKNPVGEKPLTPTGNHVKCNQS
jgi:hypothetical protein